MKTAKQYRMEAKQALSGNWGMAILATVIYGILCAVCTPIPFAILILSGVFAVGISTLFINIHRKKTVELGDLFSGFNSNCVNSILMGILVTVFTTLWSLLFVIPGIIATYSYAMAPFILADHPEMSGMDAIKASKTLMKGKKWKLFCLQFSFFGWMLLSMLTFGILMLWVTPWMMSAEADFYESIKDEVVLPGDAPAAPAEPTQPQV